MDSLGWDGSVTIVIPYPEIIENVVRWRVVRLSVYQVEKEFLGRHALGGNQETLAGLVWLTVGKMKVNIKNESETEVILCALFISKKTQINVK